MEAVAWCPCPASRGEEESMRRGRTSAAVMMRVLAMVCVAAAAAWFPGFVVGAEGSAPLPSPAWMPSWSEGTSWTVKTFYRRVRLGDGKKSKEAGKKKEERRRKAKEAGAGRSSRRLQGFLAGGTRPGELATPSYWTYKVIRRRTRGEDTAYMVNVKDLKRKEAAIASFIFLSMKERFGDLPRSVTSFCLWKARFMQKRRGRDVVWSEEFRSSARGNPLPVISQAFPIPYSFPVFPLYDPASIAETAGGWKKWQPLIEYQFLVDDSPLSASPGAAETGEAGDGEEESSSLQLVFALDIVQTQFPPSMDPDEFCGTGTRADLEQAGHPLKDLVFVELRRDFDGACVRQIWHPSYPWWLYCVTPYTRSILLTWSK